MNFLSVLLFTVLAAVSLLAFPSVRSSLQLTACRAAFNVATFLPPAENAVSLTPDAAHALNLIVKRGTDAEHYDVCGAADEPLGIVADEAASDAGSLSHRRGITLLGSWRKPELVTASEAIAVGDWVYTAANGRVQNEPGGAGTYWRLGKALSPASGAGKMFVIQPTQPVMLTVFAKMTCITTAAGSDAGTTQTLANAIKADLTAFRTATLTVGLVKQL